MRGCLLKAKLKHPLPKGQHAWNIILALGRGADGKHKQKWVRFRGTRKQAETKLTELVRSVDRNEFVEPTKQTVGEWLTAWLGKVIEPSKRRGTHRTYKTIINGRLVPALGTIRLQALRAVDLQAHYAEASKTLSPASVRMHHAIMSSALKVALKEGLVTRNVAALVDGLPRIANRNESINQNTWTANEARTFLATAKAAGPQVAALYALALDSGARKSEIGGLRWSDVNLETGTLTILRQIITEGDTPEFGPTKTGRPRTVALGTETVSLLREHKKQQAELKMKNRATYRDLGLVFAKEWGEKRTAEDRLGQPLRMHNIGEGEFGKLILAAGVKRITFHGLRHTMASMMMQEGVPAKVIQERLGHTMIATTMDIYAHVQPGMQEDAASRLAALLHG